MSEARAPRCQLLINGQMVAPIECNIHVSLHQSADTFFAKLPLVPDFGLDAAFWADTAPIPIEIRATNDQNTASFVSMFTGQVDAPQIAFHDLTVSIRGRDKTAGLAETKTSALFRNQTDMQVITQLAQANGLTVQFNQTPDNAGLQYDQDYSEIADSDSAWNMIVALARKAGCIAFVKGSVVYVQPVDTSPPNGMFTVNFQSPAFNQAASSNAAVLTAVRNLNLAKDTTVTVQSTRHKQGDTLTSTFRSKPKKASADRLIYQHRAPNLTKSQQDKITTAHLKETLSHEREIEVTNMPGDVSVIPGLMGLTLTRTSTAYDQDYILADAVHHFSNEAGYTMDLSAHNQDSSRGEPTQEQ